MNKSTELMESANEAGAKVNTAAGLQQSHFDESDVEVVAEMPKKQAECRNLQENTEEERPMQEQFSKMSCTGENLVELVCNVELDEIQLSSDKQAEEKLSVE